MSTNDDLLKHDEQTPCGAFFERRYLAIPYFPTENEIRLRELAEEYHRRCEEYDRTVCTGPLRNGEVMPADGAELVAINKNAQYVLRRLEKQVVALGFDRRQWQKAIIDAGHRYRHMP